LSRNSSVYDSSLINWLVYDDSSLKYILGIHLLTYVIYFIPLK
jgi:hypothetical protein